MQPKLPRLSLAQLAIITLTSVVAMAETPVQPITSGVDVHPLPVTTSYLGNSLNRGRGWGPEAEPSNQRWVMDWISDMAVTPDGYVFATTTYEEGIQRTGVYRDGDNVLDRPDNGGPEGTAVSASAHYFALGHGGGTGVTIYKRLPGMALDGKGGAGPGNKFDITVNTTKDYISGLVIDEAHDRLFVSFAAQSRVKVFKLSDGSPVTEFGVYEGRTHTSGPDAGGKMALDGDGNLWIIEGYEAEHPVQIPGKLSASGPPGTHSDTLESIAVADPQTYFTPAGDNGWVALDLGAAHHVSLVHYKGDEIWVGAKLQGANSLQGPWSDMYTIDMPVHSWPDEWLWLNDPASYRYIRFLSAPGQYLPIGMFEAYENVPARDGRVLCYSPAGKLLPPQIPITHATAIAWDAKGHRLLVGDNGANQQICAYVNVATNPTLDPTFGVAGTLGEKGGILAGPAAQQGKMGPLRFDYIRGVGADAAGQIYVVTMGADGINQTQIECYTPTGKRAWGIYGAAFEDQAALDPASETDVYSGHHHYKMDYSRLAGNEATLVGATANIRKYGDQMITTIAGMRRIAGKLYMILQTDRSGYSNLFRFDPPANGEFAIPMAMVRGLYNMQQFTKFPWPPNQPPGIGRFIWNDLNGDGLFSRDEFDKTNDYLIGASSFDDDLNWWFFDYSATKQVIQRINAIGPDAHGSFSWHWKDASNAVFAVPPPFARPEGNSYGIGSINYDKADHTLYLTGATVDHPMKGMPGQNFLFGSVLAKYRMTGKDLALLGQVALPWDVNIGAGDHDSPYSISLAGDYVFVGYWNMMSVRIYRKSDLGFVGQVSLGKQTAAAILDGTAAIRAYKRTGTNEYLIFESNYAGNSIIMLRWKPDVTSAPPPPDGFKVPTPAATSLTLTWKASPGADGYRVERMVSTPNGWTPWVEIARPSTATYTDPVQPARTYAYRVRAYNSVPSGGNSDYTQTIYVSSTGG